MGRSREGKGGGRNYGRFEDRSSSLSGIGLFSLFFCWNAVKIKVEYDLVLASVDEQGFF